MAQYKVRENFFLHLGENDVREPGSLVELTKEQAEKFAHQIELVKEVKGKGSEV